MNNRGKIYIVGTGPGAEEYICPRALTVMAESDVIVGYKKYIELIEPFIKDKELVSSHMKKEVERCREVLNIALLGKNVSIISSGDPGIYGMAGIMLEIIGEQAPDIEVEVVPGVSASIAANALLGAPLMNDFAVISLSDLLTPWELIIKRLHAAGSGDFVVNLYNPRSKKRIEHLDTAVEILLQYQSEATPVGIVKNAMRKEQEVIHTTLGKLLEYDIDMFTTVVIGNSFTQVINGKMITIRGYKK